MQLAQKSDAENRGVDFAQGFLRDSDVKRAANQRT
jgi:hypothetical protein